MTQLQLLEWWQVVNITRFTTGRGSVYGGKPVPSLKLATNTPMFKRMESDMDINCGCIIDGDATVESVEREFLRKFWHASGEQSNQKFLVLVRMNLYLDCYNSLIYYYQASSGPEILFLLLQALISISAPFSLTRLTS